MPKDYYTRLKNAFLDLRQVNYRQIPKLTHLCALNKIITTCGRLVIRYGYSRSVKPSKLGFTAIADYVDFIKELDSLMEKFSEIVSPKPAGTKR